MSAPSYTKGLAFLGLGRFGSELANRLLVLPELYVFNVWSKRKESVKAFEERTKSSIIFSYETPAEAIKNTSVVIIYFSTFDDIRKEILDNEEVMNLLKGTMVIQMTTITFKQTFVVHDRLTRAGAYMIECPTFGTVSYAEAGILGLLVSGKEEYITSQLDVLARMGRVQVVSFEHGKASALKLACEQVLASQMTALAFGVALTKKHGIDVNAFLTAIKHSASHCEIFDMKAPQLSDSSQHSNVYLSLQQLQYDMECLAEESSEKSLDASYIEGIKSVADHASRNGWQSYDYSAIIEGFLDTKPESVSSD